MVNAAYQEVSCADCGKTYQCTPAQDYYHKPDQPRETRTLTNGYCETCLLMGANIHPDKIIEAQ